MQKKRVNIFKIYIRHSILQPAVKVLSLFVGNVCWFTLSVVYFVWDFVWVFFSSFFVKLKHLFGCSSSSNHCLVFHSRLLASIFCCRIISFCLSIIDIVSYLILVFFFVLVRSILSHKPWIGGTLTDLPSTGIFLLYLII